MHCHAPGKDKCTSIYSVGSVLTAALAELSRSRATPSRSCRLAKLRQAVSTNEPSQIKPSQSNSWFSAWLQLEAGSKPAELCHIVCVYIPYTEFNSTHKVTYIYSLDFTPYVIHYLQDSVHIWAERGPRHMSIERHIERCIEPKKNLSACIQDKGGVALKA
jgi:hypothetical protein